MRFFFTSLLVLMLSATLGAQSALDSPGVRELKTLVDRQHALLARASAAANQTEVEDLRRPLQQLVFDYERFLRTHPDLVAGYVSYAMLLGNPLLDERRRAVGLLLKANELDADLPLVKNQLGNFLAEEGRPLDALNYFLAAVQLEPKEPLYHYQIGTLLHEARNDFLESGSWTREALDDAMFKAFEEAATLAPDNIGYAYRFGEAYYDVDRPDWEAAIAHWQALEQRMASPVEQQTTRLHQANIRLKQERPADARALLATVTEPVLEAQKQKLIAQLEVPTEK